jgi:hypothetical protein
MLKRTETLVTANNETGLEVNAAKTKFMVMCEEESLGRK